MPVFAFHLAFPVRDIEETRRFYVDVLGCREGRSTERWIDFDFFGNQISAHRSSEPRSTETSMVDGKAVPLHHFGAVLPRPVWDELRARLEAAGTTFLLEPQIRYAGKPSEQGTFFILDPSGNGLEFKSFTDESGMFAQVEAT
ncbi:dioxygenase [Roseomonas genomospecies 6]|uniref:Dioxygenase n=1 Tax=Roseomonas genomospecies 6 TaxID=214106 RepID=A0A9W7NLT0_9PROT|nr:dioxygenase [Roseomonas genomospecies 6]